MASEQPGDDNSIGLNSQQLPLQLGDNVEISTGFYFRILSSKYSMKEGNKNMREIFL